MKCLAQFETVRVEDAGPLQLFRSGLADHMHMLVEDIWPLNVFLEMGEVPPDPSFQSTEQEFCTIEPRRRRRKVERVEVCFQVLPYVVLLAVVCSVQVKQEDHLLPRYRRYSLSVDQRTEGLERLGVGGV